MDDYLGDGVYVHFDGVGIELRANDHEDPSDRIYFEPEVLAKLLGFIERCQVLIHSSSGQGFRGHRGR